MKAACFALRRLYHFDSNSDGDTIFLHFCTKRFLLPRYKIGYNLTFFFLPTFYSPTNAQTNKFKIYIKIDINPLKPELNPICYLLALLGAHHFLHVSRIRVKLLTLR